MGYNPYTGKGTPKQKVPDIMKNNVKTYYIELELKEGMRLWGTAEESLPPDMIRTHNVLKPYTFPELIRLNCVFVIENKPEAGNFRTFKKPHRTTYEVKKSRVQSILLMDKAQMRNHLATAYGYDPANPAGYEPAALCSEENCLEF